MFLKLENIKVIGLLGGVINSKKAMLEIGIIAKTMNKFISEKLWEKIPNLTNPNELLVLYSNYESDPNGNYSYFIGMQVDSIENTPKEMQSLEIPAQDYAEYTSDSGKMRKVFIDSYILFDLFH